MEREILRTALAPSAECLSIEELGRYVDGGLGADQQTAAVMHIRRCLNCQAELALLQAVTSSSVRPGEADILRDGVARLEQRATEIFAAGRVETLSRRRWFRFGSLLPVAGMAAVLLVGLVAGSFYLLPRKAPKLPSRVTTGDEVTRSLAVEVRGPSGDQVEAPQRFEWLAVDRAVRYRVRLMEVDRREVWSTSTSAVGVDLPSSVRTSIAPAKTLLWDVTAYDASGATIAESGSQSFRLAPR
jgi:hypothetical protein